MHATENRDKLQPDGPLGLKADFTSTLPLPLNLVAQEKFPFFNLSLFFLFFFYRERFGPCSRKHLVLFGCQFLVCCRNSLQGVVQSNFRWNAVEKAHSKKSPNRSFMERVIRKKRMVWARHYFVALWWSPCSIVWNIQPTSRMQIQCSSLYLPNFLLRSFSPILIRFLKMLSLLLDIAEDFEERVCVEDLLWEVTLIY